MKKLFTMVVLVIAAQTDIRAEDTLCNTSLSGTFDNVIAIPGESCFLAQATVEGNVIAENGASLFVSGGTVAGNVIAEAGSSLLVSDTVVGGDIQCNGTVRPQGCRLDHANISGNVQSIDAQGPVLFFSSMVGGDLQVFGSTQQALIGGNVIGGNLQCQENDPAPAPFGTTPNTVGGNKEDQCSGPNF